MQAQIVFRHMDSSDAVRNYAEERLTKIRKYFADPLKVSATFSVEKINQIAQFDVTLRNGLQLHSSESSENMYSSIDLALAKMEKQVRRYKDRISNHKPKRGRAAKVRQAIISAEAETDRIFAEQSATEMNVDEVKNAEIGTLNGHSIVREQEFVAQRLEIEEALMQMELMHLQFFVFTNAQTGDINVVYRHNDGNYGLIETRGHVDDA